MSSRFLFFCLSLFNSCISYTSAKDNATAAACLSPTPNDKYIVIATLSGLDKVPDSPTKKGAATKFVTGLTPAEKDAARRHKLSPRIVIPSQPLTQKSSSNPSSTNTTPSQSPVVTPFGSPRLGACPRSPFIPYNPPSLHI